MRFTTMCRVEFYRLWLTVVCRTRSCGYYQHEEDDLEQGTVSKSWNTCAGNWWLKSP